MMRATGLLARKGVVMKWNIYVFGPNAVGEIEGLELLPSPSILAERNDYGTHHIESLNWGF